MMRPAAVLPLLLLGLFQPTGTVRAEPATPTPEDVTFFATKVRPVFADHCYKCHSSKSEKLKGGLRLDPRAAAPRLGVAGASVVPGHPEQSRRVEAIGYVNVDLQ